MSNLVDSTTDIANLALDHISQKPVTDITADGATSKEEQILHRWYDQSRLVLLQMYDWNFAIKRVVLAELDTPPPFGFEEAYQLPSDYVQLLTVGDLYYEYYKEHAIEGDQLLSRYSYSLIDGLPIRYICDFKNVARMSPLFIQALSLLLAANVCYQIKNNTQEVQRLKQEFLLVMKLAKQQDAKASPVKRVNRFRTYLDNHGEYRGYRWHDLIL